MLARHRKVLERAFAAEIERALEHAPSIQHLPLQLGKSKAVRECVGEGYLFECESKLGTALGVMTVPGHELTHLGRMLICMEYAEQERANPTAVEGA